MGGVSDLWQNIMGWLVTCVLDMSWKFGRSLVVREIKPSGTEEKWKRLVVHVNVLEEKLVMGWHLTKMEAMSDFFEGCVGSLVTCVGLVRWIVGWDW